MDRLLPVSRIPVRPEMYMHVSDLERQFLCRLPFLHPRFWRGPTISFFFFSLFSAESAVTTSRNVFKDDHTEKPAGQGTKPLTHVAIITPRSKQTCELNSAPPDCQDQAGSRASARARGPPVCPRSLAFRNRDFGFDRDLFAHLLPETGRNDKTYSLERLRASLLIFSHLC